MNYKITSLILAIAVVALVAKDFFKTSTSKPEPDIVAIQAEPTKPVFRPNSIDFSQIYPAISDTTGTFILPEKAKKMLDDYHIEQANIWSQYDPKKARYGFTFGLKKVNTLMQNIEKYNLKNNDPELEITGIRVYYGVTTLADGITKYNDTFIIPVVGEYAKNYHAIDQHFDKVVSFVNDNMILNGSLPCPTDCDPKP
uniref:hypothetical protein n=1 Tax=Fulvivirga sp. TaxID=1931237 RepID=UPI00404B483A